MEKIVCKGRNFYTESDRQVLFNSINVVCKKP